MSPRVSGHRPGITKAVLAGVVATTLGLAACGSDDADGDEATSTSASASSTSRAATSSAAESGDASESAEPGPGEESAEPAPGENPDAEPGAGVALQGGGDGAAPAGAAANNDDAAQITALEKGFGEDRTYADYQRYTIEHTCNADVDQEGGREALMQDAGTDGELAQTMMSEVMGGTLPVIHGVNDIRVNGDRATANLDQTTNGNRQVLPKNYVREDGQWRTCVA